MIELETVETCDLCGGTRFRPRKVWRDQLLFGPEAWTLVSCEGCDLRFINPRPTRAAIGGFYPSDYAAHHAPATRPKWWHRRVASRDAPPLRLYERPLMMVMQDLSWYRFPAWHGEGRVLDVGCGSGGRYLDVLRALGWTTHGIEPSAAAVAHAREKGHDAIAGTAEEQHFPDASMDLVTIWHTLEHCHSPRKALESIHRTLRPGGILSLCVPNYHSAQSLLFGRFWWSTDAPRHLVQLTRPHLRRYLEDVGFQLRWVATRTGATSWQRGIRHALNALLGTRWSHDKTWATAPFEIACLLGSLVRFWGVGSELRVIAAKPA